MRFRQENKAEIMVSRTNNTRSSRKESITLAFYCLITLLSISIPNYLHAEIGTPEIGIQRPISKVNTDTISNPPSGDWLSYGRDYHEQRYSQLNQIDSSDVQNIGLAWYFDTEYKRGLEATPLVVDGVMYVTGNWSVVYALNAATGELIWKYDPNVPKEWGKMACCDAVNRGVAVYEGRVFVGSLDARLIALDAENGSVLWDVKTADTSTYPYTITGAPRAAKGKVYIGNGGSEYGARGFVSAYDVDTGSLVWRFYTVPRNPEETQENAVLENAAETWTGEWWRSGGGGTVWDSIVYDPELDQLYIGVGNGSPWNRRVRSPNGGDNLFLSSIVALDPDTGEYIWHFQETPAETWDYTATQHIMLADMDWQGKPKKVIWHAPKNGFFFIIDRENGQLLSAEPFARVNWASHYNLATGRPVENIGMDYSEDTQEVYPSPHGAHNWHPMSHHPGTGLVYIPTLEVEYFYTGSNKPHEWGHWNTSTTYLEDPMGSDLEDQEYLRKVTSGYLTAWDPRSQSVSWRIERELAWNGGTLATAGDLVFQGLGSKRFVAVNASSGETLWEFSTQSGVIGSPITYMVGDEQYVAVPVGWGGSLGLMLGLDLADGYEIPSSRIVSFKLDGESELPPLPLSPKRQRPPARLSENEEILRRGAALYAEYCMHCHGQFVVSNGRIPDLRRLPRSHYDAFDAIVLEGGLKKLGMAGFKDVLSGDDAFKLKAYIVDAANDDWETSLLQ